MGHLNIGPFHRLNNNNKFIVRSMDLSLGIISYFVSCFLLILMQTSVNSSLQNASFFLLLYCHQRHPGGCVL